MYTFGYRLGESQGPIGRGGREKILHLTLPHREYKSYSTVVHFVATELPGTDQQQYFRPFLFYTNIRYLLCSCSYFGHNIYTHAFIPLCVCVCICVCVCVCARVCARADRCDLRCMILYTYFMQRIMGNCSSVHDYLFEVSPNFDIDKARFCFQSRQERSLTARCGIYHETVDTLSSITSLKARGVDLSVWC